jgi:hypothetical protein
MCSRWKGEGRRGLRFDNVARTHSRVDHELVMIVLPLPDPWPGIDISLLGCGLTQQWYPPYHCLIVVQTSREKGLHCQVNRIPIIVRTIQGLRSSTEVGSPSTNSTHPVMMNRQRLCGLQLCIRIAGLVSISYLSSKITRSFSLYQVGTPYLYLYLYLL